MLRYTLLLLALLAGALDATAANVLLVTATSTLTSDESARRTQFQTWGHTVTTIVDSDTQTNFNTAMAAVDVVYVPMTVQESELTNKVKTTTKGVVCEERYLDVYMGFSTALGWDASHTQTEVLNNSHSVSTGLSTGYVTIVTSSQQLALMNPTVAGGMTVLSKQNYSAGNMLGVIDTGGALAGGGTAAGRRVRMPWGGDSFAWSTLNASGLKIAQQAIQWAVGDQGPRLWWKLDETNGSTVNDASGNNYHGTLTGTTTWVNGRRNGGVDIVSGAKASVSNLLGKPTSFTVAAWVDCDSVGGTGGVAVSVGDHIALVMDEPSNGGLPAVAFNYSGSNFRWASGGTAAVGKGWRHYVGVFDDAANTLKLYIDGVLVGTTSTTNSIDWVTTIGATTVVGGTSYPTPYNFDGRVDDVRVYGRALSEAEIAEAYGLIAHWKLNETSGATADDSSLANNDATRTGTALWTEGSDNGAHEFNYLNGDDYFQSPTNTALNDVQKGDYTLMAYFKPNSVPPGSNSANDSSYGILRKSGWHLGLVYGSDGSLFFEHWLQSGPTWNGAGDWEFHAPNRFYHVAGVVSRTEGTIKIYVDGVLKQTSTFTPGAAPYDYGSTPWRIGISNPGASEWRHAADGVIDDARIYNRALSAEEIAPFAEPGLVAHWSFDEGVGTVAKDATKNGYNANFAAGTPTWVQGVRGQALQFNGSSDILTGANFNPPATGAIALWFRPSGSAGSSTHLLGTSLSWRVERTSSAKLRYNVGVNPGLSTTESFEDLVNWRHLVVNYNHKTGAQEIYVDGQLVHTGTFTMTDQTTAQLTIGGRTGSTARVSGAIDDLRIYSHNLTAAEVAELYGLVGHWKFDEGAGATVTDSSGAENDGAFATGSPSWVTGIRGSALSFDGSTTAATNQAFDPPATGAVALWCRFTASPTSSQRLIGLGGDWEVRADSAGTIFADLGADGIGAGFQTPAGTAVGSQWRHLIACFDADNDDFELYLDGALTASGSLAISKQVAQILSFGTRTGSTERFNGSLDDVRVYNRWLQPREIAELYGLVGHWKLDETSGGVATDSSGAGRHGTYLGSPTLGLGGPGSGSVAATFDGLDDCVSIPTVNDTFADGVTIAGWMKPIAANNYAKLMQLSVGTSLGIDLGRLGTSNDLRGIVDNGAEFAMSGALHSNVWRHYTMTMDATGSMRLYRNGALLGAAARSPVPVAIRTNNWIGASNWGTDELFEGQMHDVRLYNRPISDEEATALYLGGNVFPSVRIVKWVEVANP